MYLTYNTIGILKLDTLPEEFKSELVWTVGYPSEEY